MADEVHSVVVGVIRWGSGGRGRPGRGAAEGLVAIQRRKCVEQAKEAVHAKQGQGVAWCKRAHGAKG